MSSIQRFFDNRYIDIDVALPAAEAVAEWEEIAGRYRSAQFVVNDDELFYTSGSGQTRIITRPRLDIELEAVVRNRLPASERVAILLAVDPWNLAYNGQGETQAERLLTEARYAKWEEDSDVVLLSPEESRKLSEGRDEAPITVFTVPTRSAPRKVLARKLRALLADLPLGRRELLVDHLARMTDPGSGQSATVFLHGHYSEQDLDYEWARFPDPLPEGIMDLLGAEVTIRKDGHRILRRYHPVEKTT